MSRAKLTGLIAAAVALIGCVVALCLLVPIVTVSEVTVEGSKETEPEAIVEAAGVQVGENSLRVDTSSAARRVAGLPWVKSATVGHSSPRHIEVTVQEHEPFVYSEQRDGAHLADRDGVPFVITDDPRGALRIVGMKDDNPAIYRAVVEAVSAWERVAPQRRGDLLWVEAPSPYELTLHFAAGENGEKHMYWGSAGDADNKAKASAALLSREEESWNVTNPRLVTTR